MQPPYDIKRGPEFDFFSEEGKKTLDELEQDPALAAEHWGPECRLFSRARGKPVQLDDGTTVRGPQAVRDEKHVMGFPWLSKQMKIELRRSNNMALRGLKRAKTPFGSERFLTMEHPYNSWLWYFNLVKELQSAGYQFAVGTACCFGGDREKWYALLNNSPAIHAELHRPDCPGHQGLRGYGATRQPDGSLRFATEEESEYKQLWCQAYARGLRRELEHHGWISQSVRDGRRLKIQHELQQATERLKQPAVALAISAFVVELEAAMRRGQELTHLKEMARRTSIRGTDLRLLLGDNQMEVPYPAYRWLWKEVLAYGWREERHINEGEVSAFNTMLRRRAKDPAKHCTRYLAVVDSLVSRGAISKGRVHLGH